MQKISFTNVFSRANYNLLSELVRTDFKIRYQGSALGYLWSLLKPLALFAILYTVFETFLKIGSDSGIENYSLYLLLGIVIWGFFTEATGTSMGAIVENGGLIRKISIPKYLLVVARTINASINLSFNLAVVGMFMFFGDTNITVSALLFIPILVELYIVSLAVGFFLSALFVKYRDMGFIWEVIIQGAFYATPILYPLSLVPGNFAKWLMLNPLAQIIQDARYVLISTKTQTVYSLWGDMLWLIPFALIAVAAVTAALYFRSRQSSFAEEV